MCIRDRCLHCCHHHPQWSLRSSRATRRERVSPGLRPAGFLLRLPLRRRPAPAARLDRLRRLRGHEARAGAGRVHGRWIVTGPAGLPGWLVRLRTRIEGALDGSEHATFWALFVIYATPLGAGPLRLVAAAGGFPLARFALAIFLGCLPYYFALAWFGKAVRLPTWVYASAIVAIVAIAAAQFM